MAGQYNQSNHIHTFDTPVGGSARLEGRRLAEELFESVVRVLHLYSIGCLDSLEDVKDEVVLSIANLFIDPIEYWVSGGSEGELMRSIRVLPDFIEFAAGAARIIGEGSRRSGSGDECVDSSIHYVNTADGDGRCVVWSRNASGKAAAMCVGEPDAVEEAVRRWLGRSGFRGRVVVATVGCEGVECSVEWRRFEVSGAGGVSEGTTRVQQRV